MINYSKECKDIRRMMEFCKKHQVAYKVTSKFCRSFIDRGGNEYPFSYYYKKLYEEGKISEEELILESL
jgi:arsenate reductase-like glutaredoxin family protein